ncbi:hypothetical protein ACFFRR_009551 [Megaselia abdita]
MPLKNFMMYHRCLFLFKLILLDEPKYLFDKLEFLRTPRFILNLIIPSNELHGPSKRFLVHDVRFWNAIPNDVKIRNSVPTYKTKSIHYFKNTYGLITTVYSMPKAGFSYLQ